MGKYIFLNLISHISQFYLLSWFPFLTRSHINLFFFSFFLFLGQVSTDCENKPFGSFWPFSGIGWSSLFRYHEWALTLTLARLLTQRCVSVFSANYTAARECQQEMSIKQYTQARRGEADIGISWWCYSPGEALVIVLLPLLFSETILCSDC